MNYNIFKFKHLVSVNYFDQVSKLPGGVGFLLTHRLITGGGVGSRTRSFSLEIKNGKKLFHANILVFDIFL